MRLLHLDYAGSRTPSEPASPSASVKSEWPALRPFAGAAVMLVLLLGGMLLRLWAYLPASAHFHG